MSFPKNHIILEASTADLMINDIHNCTTFNVYSIFKYLLYMHTGIPASQNTTAVLNCVYVI